MPICLPMRGLFTLFLILGITFSGFYSASAQSVTSGKVFQVTEDILHQLERLHEANLSIPNLMDVNLDMPPRQPRHVLQQARHIRGKIQILKRINALEAIEIKPLPVKDVSQEDLLNEAEMILSELTEFDKPFALAPFKRKAVLAEDKTDTDVFLNLLRAQAMIEQLGLPETIPNDVYTTLTSIAGEVKLIATAADKSIEVDPPAPSIGKTPKDTYSLALYTLKGIQSLAKIEEFKIDGGVEIPNRKIRKISSADVEQLLLFSLAELSAMKVKVGAKDALPLPKGATGQTPTSVFDLLGLVNGQIQEMQW